MNDTRSTPRRAGVLRLAAGVLLAAGAILLLTASWFAVANPSVHVTVEDPGPGGGTNPVECSVAPYDVVLNDEVPSPGGEHAPGWADEVTERCTVAADASIARSLQCAGGAALLLGAGGALRLMESARRRRDATQAQPAV